MTASGRDAEHWRHWGFLRRSLPETTPPALHSPRANSTATNQTLPTNNSQQHTQATTNPQATLAHPTTNWTQPTGTTPYTCRQQAQANIQHPTTGNGKAPDIASVPHQPNPNHNQPMDNYLSPWGDHLQQPKPPNTFRIFLQNFGGWPTSAKVQKTIISAALWTLWKSTTSLPQRTMSHGTKSQHNTVSMNAPADGGNHYTSLWPTSWWTQIPVHINQAGWASSASTGRHIKFSPSDATPPVSGATVGHYSPAKTTRNYM